MALRELGSVDRIWRPLRRIVVVHARRTPIVVAQHVTSAEKHGLLTLRLRTKRPHSHGLNEHITHLRFDPKEDPRNDFNAKIVFIFSIGRRSSADRLGPKHMSISRRVCPSAD